MDSSGRRYDVIIVGGGPAGLAAGLYSRRAALDAIVLEKGLPGGQIAISKEVENYPGVEGVTGFDLAERMARQARSFGLAIDQQEAVEVIPGAGCHAVRLAGGELLRATALILAMGGTARRLGVAGESEYQGRGVSYCATCDGYFYRDRVVAVVGGGDTAAEEAVFLARVARRVFLIHRGEALKASRILRERVMAEPRIGLLPDSIVTEIRGDGEQVRSVVIEGIEGGERTTLSVEGVFIFIGYSPNNRLVPPEIAMNNEGLVVTDGKCETTVAGIFAAGDLRRKYANQIVIAAADGAVAGLAASRHVEMRTKADLNRPQDRDTELCRSS